MKHIAFSTLVATGLALGATGAFAQDIVIKAGHTNVAGSIQDMGLQKLRDLLEEKTDGKATIEIFPNGQIGDEAQLVEGVLLGTVEMAMTSNSVLSNYVSDLRVLDMPFMFENIMAMSDAVEQPAAKEAMQAASESAGFELIGTYSSGIRHMMTKKPIESFADVEGLKLRTMQVPMHVSTWRAFGANPTPLAYAELYGALQSGVVDGAEGATSDYNAQKFYEVASDFALVGWLNLTAQIVMNEAKFNELPEDVRAALMEAGEESALWQRKYVVEQEEPLLAELEGKGVTITKPALADFREKAKPLYEEFLETDSQKTLFETLSQ
ncbi:TRAP transporter substrate-binding protein [Acuticoccus sp. MNP-M23]|uniref:TRAP transporter substrate-binding protein n=1 Tax=Acuticoccus sp. MNP-M23 TaxID=3072793 RepID=UPI0028151F0C|nr:TRAP transporter substrate-binding protein [Acuticoccus sp. MNP-M23]WMS41538.1 TRAP transporter substrate-binding protein [Acuticoccus sp. MNP-M23]